MDYSLSIWSIASYVEANITEDIDYSELEKISGFSYRHIRSIVKSEVGVSLSQYILSRKIANAAFDIVHSTQTNTDIAFKYDFNSYDAFARAFKRLTGLSPKAFKDSKRQVGHKRILMGVYAPEIYNSDISTFTHTIIREDEMNKNIENKDKSCLLYGVPKVAYSFEECTPLAVSIKAALNYLGDPIDYSYLMAVSGAAFRLRWNKNYWDGGNVDVLNIYENQYDILKHAFDASGRTFQLLTRDGSTKEDFIDFIKKEIDAGRPVIALGIIGPPEACLVTGYQDDGQSLLGWNCFQDSKEMATGVSYHDCGYYITDAWWENKATIALISIGDKMDQKIGHKEVIENAITILETEELSVKLPSGNVRDTFAGGQAAYDLWARGISDDSLFTKETIMPLKIEKLMCQADAQTMVGEGRSYAGIYLEYISKDYPQLKEPLLESAKHFKASAKAAIKMSELRGGFEQTNEILNNFMQKEVRKETVKLIHKAQDEELKALKLLREIVLKM